MEAHLGRRAIFVFDDDASHPERCALKLRSRYGAEYIFANRFRKVLPDFRPKDRIFSNTDLKPSSLPLVCVGAPFYLYENCTVLAQHFYTVNAGDYLEARIRS